MSAPQLEVSVRVELLLVPDCPHAHAARAVLADAIGRLGARVAVQERVGDYPSPTVLVDGVDVVTGRVFEEQGVATCRLDLPTVSNVVAAVRAGSGNYGQGVDGDWYPPGLAVGVTIDRIGGVSPEARRLHRAVLRHFAAAGVAASEAGLGGVVPDCDVRSLLRELHEHDVIRLDEAGLIRAAYPFSGVPTTHRVAIDSGPTVSAMCAVDALGMAAMLGRTVAIESVDPDDGTEIRVAVTPAGDTTWTPETTTVFVGSTDPSALAGSSESAAQSCCEPGDVAVTAADRCCGVMNFFASPDSANRWLQAHPEVGGVVLTQRQAWRLGVDIFRHLLED